jgi:hypothetical protein
MHSFANMSSPTGVKSALNPGHVYAHRAEVCPGFQARFCPPCISLPRIWGNIYPPVHKYELDFGQCFTPLGMAFSPIQIEKVD